MWRSVIRNKRLSSNITYSRVLTVLVILVSELLFEPDGVNHGSIIIEVRESDIQIQPTWAAPPCKVMLPTFNLSAAHWIIVHSWAHTGSWVLIIPFPRSCYLQLCLTLLALWLSLCDLSSPTEEAELWRRPDSFWRRSRDLITSAAFGKWSNLW